MRKNLFPLLLIPIIFLLSGCRTEILNNIEVRKEGNKTIVTGQSKLVFDKETSKVLSNEKQIIDDILKFYKENSLGEVVYKVENGEINIISGIVTDNSDIFSINTITNNTKSLEIKLSKPLKLVDAITKASDTLPDSKIRNSITLNNFYICNIISVEGDIISIKYNKDIWEVGDKYKNEVKLCSNLTTIEESTILVNFTTKDESKTIYYLYGGLILILILYIIKKIIY